MPSASSASTTAGPQASAPRASFAAGITPPWWWLGLAATMAGLVGALLFTGAAAARQLADPGALTRWGLPVAIAVNNVSLAAVVGALVFAVVILPQDLRPHRPHHGRPKDGHTRAIEPEHPAFSAALTLAAAASSVWTLAAIAVLVLTYSDVAGLPLSGTSEYTQQLVFFMTGLPVGQAWLTVVIIAAVVTTLCFGVRSLNALAVTLVLALVGFVPQALIGHSASSADHNGAVNSLLLHIVGVSLWLGGIITLVVVSGKLGKLTGTVLRRFSALALYAFVGVAASGVINAAIRITNLHDLFYSSYGQVVLAKSAATVVLGVIGYMHRSWILPRLDAGEKPTTAARTRRLLWQLVFGELLIMGITSGLAVGLSRSAPPQARQFLDGATPAEILTGYPLPPELTPSRWFTEWRLDWLWLAVILVLGAAYLSGVLKLHRRGDRWPVLRIVSWLAGLLALFYITSGGAAVYGQVLFSAHMVEHMALMVISPLFLVLGSPVSLALKALTPRRDGSRGLREWILVLVHSRFSRLVTHPLFAAANFAGSLILFYYSGAFDLAMRYHVGHELMVLHFTLTGYVFILSMIGSDPLPRRAPYPLRLLLLLATMAFHAFFGVALMSSTVLLAGDYFGNMGRAWGESAIADQQLAGGIAWGVGEVPTLAIALGVALMWSRSDARESRRRDRAADRNNDADLGAYNDMFAQLAAQDAALDVAHAGPGIRLGRRHTDSDPARPAQPDRTDPPEGTH